MIDRRTMLALLASAALPALAAETARLQLLVPKWSCGSCAISTCEALAKAEGVLRLISRIKSKHLFIEYDPARLDPKALIELVRKTGYEAVPDPEATWPKLDPEQAARKIVHAS